MPRLAVTAALLAVLASCSSAPTGAQREAENRTVSFRGCDKVKCSGVLAGAAYEVKLPQTWNGTLLIYSHGYRAAEPSPPDNSPVSTSAQSAPSDEAAKELLDAGFALAGSAYAKNGWAVKEGVQAGEDLYGWFRDEVGTPDRVYVWGTSLGGLITETLAEKHPEWVAGAVPMCGPLAGMNASFDLALDLAFAVKTLLYPELKLTGYASHAEAVQYYNEATNRVIAAAKDTKNGVPKLLAMQAIMDAPFKTARFDGSTIVSKGSALAESVLTGLGFATWGRYDVETRVGGNPSGNAGVDYGARVSAGERALAEQLAPGALDAALAQLAKAPRITADPAARQKAAELGNPTGDIQDPTITLHTGYDPLVLVQNESVFADRVRASSKRTADLVQVFTEPPQTYSNPAPYGAGHCNFTVDEQTGMIRALDAWVKSGTVPGPELIGVAMRGAKGYSPLFTPGPWPATVS
jgi:pimeloyl-ACP methyl ester carboxylesterase